MSSSQAQLFCWNSYHALHMKVTKLGMYSCSYAPKLYQAESDSQTSGCRFYTRESTVACASARSIVEDTN